jgi:hypothetical protein
LVDVHTVSLNWGDGSSTVGSLPVGARSLSLSHAYTAAGVYELAVSVGDGVGSSSAVFNYVVIYDPTAGFVTGGGWITSPAGAYVADPGLTGKANFGFVSRYQKGAKTPTGNTEFHFLAGDMDFHSTVYEWLVIAGSKAQFKGSGKIDNAGDYGFLLTGIDGSPDRLRMKIWDKVTGQIVYDNQMGLQDNTSEPATALGGGSITVHK